jgi:hypothetical protein
MKASKLVVARVLKRLRYSLGSGENSGNNQDYLSLTRRPIVAEPMRRGGVERYNGLCG